MMLALPAMKNLELVISQPWADFRDTRSPDFSMYSKVPKRDELPILCLPQDMWFWALIIRVSLRSNGNQIHSFSSTKQMEGIM